MLLQNIVQTTRHRMRSSLSTVAAQSAPKKQTRPRLPVPALRATLDQYLKSVQPLLLEEEARNGSPYDAAYAKRVQWAQEFEHGIGKILQDRLLDLDRQSPHNWLEDNFWTNVVYLDYRAPLLINSNWWLALFNDDTVPDQILSHGPDWVTPMQVRRAAWMTHRILEFKDKLLSQELHPDTTKTGLWVRDSTSNMFNIARIPLKPRDAISPPPPPSDPRSRNILVMIHNKFYAINMYPNSSNEHLSPARIEQALLGVVRDAQYQTQQGQECTPVGILSADHRDTWAKNLEHLLSLSSNNQRIHEIINSSIFCLSLDAYTHSSSPSPTATVPVGSMDEINSHLHNIRSGRGSAQNRWFDKGCTLILESNTRAGAMGEHSPCDALVPSIVMAYACVENIDPAAFPRVDEAALADPQAKVEGSVHQDEGRWERLDWVVDDYIRGECVAAEGRAKAIIDDSDDAVMWFSDYGSQWIQSVARLSPDAYVQMALQLAYYRHRGEFSATYETALTRNFDRGRTETIRSLTADSRAFVLGMLNASLSTQDKWNLLARAVQSHTSLTRLAATGRGIDRHLLGLRLLLKPDEQGSPSSALLEDHLFPKSQEWKLCTSGLGAGPYFRGTGFGAMYPDGYGINYITCPDLMKFGVESKFSSPLTSTSGLQKEIRQALQDMKEISLLAAPQSKANL